MRPNQMSEEIKDRLSVRLPGTKIFTHVNMLETTIEVTVRRTERIYTAEIYFWALTEETIPLFVDRIIERLKKYDKMP